MIRSSIARIVVAAVVASSGAGCIESHLTPCANGRACPADRACDEVHLTCVTPEQLEVCTGSADLAPCSAGDVTGRCYGGVCLTPGCDNGVVEPDIGEQCDDFNHVPGDGCSADCRSNETCGNGIVDSLVGEPCDDGNLASHDGCDSRCQIESVTWRAFPITSPAVGVTTTVFDVARGKLVAVVEDNGTWEWDGTAWQLPSINGPNVSWRAGVYDPGRQRVVMFGQATTGTFVAEWDGATWTPIATQGPPPPQGVFLAVYDPTRHAALILGAGYTSYFDLVTGQWTPSAMTPFNTNLSIVSTAAYDVTRGEVVVLDSVASSTLTWVWDGVAWRSIAAKPTNLINGATLVYDPTRAAVVAVGGYLGAAGNTGRVSAWNGTTWSDTGAAFAPCRKPVVWSDPTRGSLNIVANFSMISELTGTVVADHSPIVPTPMPMVYDPVRDRIVMQEYSLTSPNSAWIFDGTWHPHVSAVRPPDTRGLFAFDPVRGGAIQLAATATGETATWMFGDGWQQLPITGPDLAAAILYDYDAREMFTLVPGGTATLPSDGTTWQMHAAANSPSNARGGATYDLGQHAPVVFDADYPNARFTVLTGDRWTESLSPGSLFQVTGSLARRSVLFVGQYEFAGGSLPVWQPLWEYRNADWEYLGLPPVPIRQGFASRMTERSFGRLDIATQAYSAYVLLERQWVSNLPDESCVAGDDADGDGVAGCDDPDCWWKCHPVCPYAATCP